VGTLDSETLQQHMTFARFRQSFPKKLTDLVQIFISTYITELFFVHIFADFQLSAVYFEIYFA
jgi:hypothetical protein